MSETSKPEEQIKDAAWKFTGTAVMVIGFFLGGVGIAYTQWGDAPRIRAELKEKDGRISGLNTEKENLEHQVGRLERQLSSVSAELEAAKAAAKVSPPEANSEPGTGAEVSP